jgi:hypothetical protein
MWSRVRASLGSVLRDAAARSMNGYFEFRKRGGSPLPDEFELPV